MTSKKNSGSTTAGTGPFGMKAMPYTPLARAGVFLRAAFRLENPLYAVALEGMIGVYSLPKKLEYAYEDRIRATCDRTGTPESKALKRIVDIMCWSRCDDAKTMPSLCSCGEYHLDFHGLLMLDRYLEIARTADAYPDILPEEKIRTILGGICGRASELLGLELPFPADEAASLGRIVSLYRERFGNDAAERKGAGTEDMAWGVIPCQGEGYTPAKRIRVFITALFRMRNPFLEVAKEGYFGGYDISGGLRQKYFYSLEKGIGKSGSEEMRALLRDVGHVELVYRMGRAGTSFSWEHRLVQLHEDLRSVHDAVGRIASMLGRDRSVLGAGLSAALERRIARMEEELRILEHEKRQADAGAIVPGSVDRSRA